VQNRRIEQEYAPRDISTWKVLVVLFAGAAAGFLVLFGDAPWWDEHHRMFSHEGAFVLWAGLMCAQTALWALALAWLMPSVSRLRAQYARENRTEVVASTAMILAIVVGLALGGPLVSAWPDYVPRHAVKVGALTLIGALVGLVAARGVWFVHGGLKRLSAEELATEKALETFVALQDNLHRFLGTLGAILGMIVLSAGAQRQAVPLTHPAPNTTTNSSWCTGSSSQFLSPLSTCRRT
jgi:hypothetical protein